MKPLSSKISNIPASMTLAVNDKAKAMQRAGQDVIALAGGDPDFDTPAHIVETAVSALH
ncbi:MAG: pyridoxal phosphate-dependent aminotransferase, partial [Chloroflexi bacterium]|nr:pyridoxal phosphate-dependent aminotransferase [Chloroflexota bacterium]